MGIFVEKKIKQIDGNFISLRRKTLFYSLDCKSDFFFSSQPLQEKS